ncbi:hypothetical protein [Streptomyces sp. OE57]|uniref:hypothetical protein n=1 Tax=Streptomyces lacaronensis TaxID=3379885 RepID=UPI0039B75069
MTLRSGTPSITPTAVPRHGPEPTARLVRSLIRLRNDMLFGLCLDMLLDGVDYQLTFVNDPGIPSLNAAHAVGGTRPGLFRELSALEGSTGIRLGVYQDPATPPEVLAQLRTAHYRRTPSYDEHWYALDLRAQDTAVPFEGAAPDEPSLSVREILDPTEEDIRRYADLETKAGDVPPALADRMVRNLLGPDRNAARTHLFRAVVDGEKAAYAALLVAGQYALLPETGGEVSPDDREIRDALTRHRLRRARELTARSAFAIAGTPDRYGPHHLGMDPLWVRAYWSPPAMD